MEGERVGVWDHSNFPSPRNAQHTPGRDLPVKRRMRLGEVQSASEDEAPMIRAERSGKRVDDVGSEAWNAGDMPIGSGQAYVWGRARGEPPPFQRDPSQITPFDTHLRQQALLKHLAGQLQENVEKGYVAVLHQHQETPPLGLVKPDLAWGEGRRGRGD